MRSRALLALFAIVLTACAFAADNTAPNSDPIYQQLRHPSLGSEAIAVNNVVLKRDAGTFRLQSGTVCFMAPVNGKVTGAVFTGHGTFSLEAPTAVERHSVSLLTKSNEMVEEYDQFVLRFTDDTYDQLKKATGATATTVSCPAGLANEPTEIGKKKVKTNFAARLLQDVLSSQPGGYFAAFIKGKRYDGQMLYVIDPHGVVEPFNGTPEEVMLMTYDENKFGVWGSFHLAGEYAKHAAVSTQRNEWLTIPLQKIDLQIEKSGKLDGTATAEIVASVDGVRVVAFNLFPTLRVSSVTDETGKPLSFIQEDKIEDGEYFAILPRELKKGEKFIIKTVYSGKDAVRVTGEGNYYPVARDNWFPAAYGWNYTQYEMRFHHPKDTQLVSTGVQVSQKAENGQHVSEWKTETPIAVAGFHLGKWKRSEMKLDKIGGGPFVIEAYTNTELPDNIKSLQNAMNAPEPEDRGPVNLGGVRHTTSSVALGTMDTGSMAKLALAQAEESIKLYDDYFGAPPIKRLAVTQQTAGNFGQAWPGLVWMPITYFYDSNVRSQLGMKDATGYFRFVEPHEIAHQWWGHAVAWPSYRDQWMSEGFAEFSASLYAQRLNLNEFNRFWKERYDEITQRNAQGFRAIDAGPLTLGYRLSNSRAGFDITRRLIYPKGGYVLHMLRMMMWTSRNGDADFKAAMHDFVKTYFNKPASTEDFKAIMEKHITPAMNLTNDGKLDWFFNEFVYGTSLPTYKLDYSYEGSGDSAMLKLKISQSNVDPNFKMIVPLYMETNNGHVLRLATLAMNGNETQEQVVPVKALKERPKRLMLNYFHDVLCSEN